MTLLGLASYQRDPREWPHQETPGGCPSPRDPGGCPCQETPGERPLSRDPLGNSSIKRPPGNGPHQETCGERPVKRPPGDAPTKRPPGNAHRQETLGDAPVKRPPGNDPHQETCGGQPRQETPGGCPHQETLGGQRYKETPGGCPHQETSGDAPVWLSAAGMGGGSWPWPAGTRPGPLTDGRDGLCPGVSMGLRVRSPPRIPASPHPHVPTPRRSHDRARPREEPAAPGRELGEGSVAGPAVPRRRDVLCPDPFSAAAVAAQRFFRGRCTSTAWRAGLCASQRGPLLPRRDCGWV